MGNPQRKLPPRNQGFKTLRKLETHSTSQASPWQKFLKFLILIFGLAFAALLIFSSESFIEFDAEGKARLKPWRKEKLEKELEEYENAEQYVLIVVKAGYYPCFSCGDQTKIYMYPGEIWKYGVTMKGEQGRYRGGLPYLGLIYRLQFRGTLQECLRLEKIKIYDYPLLPENLKRDKKLNRPPGNQRDF